MDTSLWTSKTSSLSLFLLHLYLASAHAIHFNITRFDGDDPRILYEGDAGPSRSAAELNINYDYVCRVGRVISAEALHLWDANTNNLSHFRTSFSFTIDTLGRASYAAGLAFFLAPVGFEMPPNSVAGFLGLFNTTTMADSFRKQIFLVEFDSFSNSWDPPFEHVGINNNSLSSAVFTRWNASFHSGDTADVHINYNATTKHLSVYWSYRRRRNATENTSLSYHIDLSKILPEWVTFGFSAATSHFSERHILKSWEFSSSLELDVKEKEREDTKKKTLLVGLIVSGTGVVIIGMVIVFMVMFRKRKRKNRGEAETVNLTSMNADLERGAGPRRFSYADLASATNNFSEKRKLGQGGFGEVYKGYLNDLDLIVAVKKISSGSRQGKKEYVTEVKVISSLRHRNLVQLIGWCHDKGEFLLVYEFMPNGSLDYHLFGKISPLTWPARYKIALGLTSALLYLHEEWEQCVVHRDIKSSNVMLDSNFNVKLGDFGLARLVEHDMGPQTTGLVGTLGYLAPEYVSTGRASKESDIYSFGVVALEIATGKKSTAQMEEDSEMGLVEWVWDLYGKGKMLSAVDERMLMDFEQKQVECLMIVGLWCAHPDRCLRPSIKQAIQVLNFEAMWPNLPTSMPVPVYHVPMFSMTAGEAFVTTSLEA
ncbi:L-type lectin-domain containing receptor kinase IX.1 [Morus notabilis]|uniref:L-type lectin-domain containing receptor kinase IX.1 n=1 Tax=Morus notabilis TaxID=981085 RepID=W9SDW8_9ROSA|nr:L-type lectin-domain containing receptor kinase IX.1 [Morus notabilis]EXC36487.1 L-type lectin-domain containing receptor kinase IX.1 [Morus notabilis]